MKTEDRIQAIEDRLAALETALVTTHGQKADKTDLDVVASEVASQQVEISLIKAELSALEAPSSRQP